MIAPARARQRSRFAGVATAEGAKRPKVAAVGCTGPPLSAALARRCPGLRRKASPAPLRGVFALLKAPGPSAQCPAGRRVPDSHGSLR